MLCQWAERAEHSMSDTRCCRLQTAIAAVEAAIKRLPANDTLEYGVLAEGAPPGNDDPPNVGSKVRTCSVRCSGASVCQLQMVVWLPGSYLRVPERHHLVNCTLGPLQSSAAEHALRSPQEVMNHADKGADCAGRAHRAPRVPERQDVCHHRHPGLPEAARG